MSPEKLAIDNKRSTNSHTSATRIPGQVGWGLDRQHLRAKSKIITDDMQIAVYPVPKEYITGIDRHRTTLFTSNEGDRASTIDKKLGIDYQMFHAMNMRA